MIRLLLVLLALSAAVPLQARTLGSLDFQPCEVRQPGVTGVAWAECTKFSVAENPQAPKGRQIELALTLFPAQTAQPKPDVVTMLAGGPGQSAVDAYFSVRPVLESLRRERHVLLVDQRGTGGSNRLACPLPDWNSPRKPTLAEIRQQAADCLRQRQTHADVRWYGSTEAVRDLEAVRIAAAIPQWNLIGGSYGTRVAQEVLRRHPASVRTMLIDGVAPPALPLLQDHARNLEEALQKMSARCSADKACAARFGDVYKSLYALRDELRVRPRDVSLTHPRTEARITRNLNEGTLGGVARLFAYAPETLSLLPLLVDEARQGRGEALLAQVEMMSSRLEEVFAHGMELSVVCAEDAPLLKKRAEDEASLMGNEIIDYTLAQCEVWPHNPMPADFKQPLVSDKPVLILSGELDPVTPARYGDEAAKTLSRSRHLVAKGAGHIAMLRGCLPKLVKQFIARADAQSLDAECMKDMDDTPFFLGYGGPAP